MPVSFMCRTGVESVLYIGGVCVVYVQCVAYVQSLYAVVCFICDMCII